MWYEGYSEIIDIPLAFWTLSEIKNSPRSKVKREDWTGKKTEIRPAVSKHGDKEDSGLGHSRK